MTTVQQVGKYPLKDCLGKGGMGEVWSSHDPDLHIPVAVKILYAKLSESNPQFVERFSQEAAHAARLNHPNIVRIYAAGREGDLRYMVMEHLSGGTAKDLIANVDATDSQDRVRAVIRDAAAGLAAAHAAGIIHRDVKPDNILFDHQGTAKLADLGIGKGITDATKADLTMTGTVVGTPNYVSPEQAQDSKRVDARSDLYSLGATWFCLATGKTPFKGETAVSIMLAHCREDRPDPRDVNPRVSDNDARIMMKLMAVAPDDRYQSAVELLEDLDGKTSAAPTPKPSSNRSVWLYVAAALAAITLAGLAFVLLRGDPQAPQQSSSTPISEDPPSATATGKITWAPIKAGSFSMGTDDNVDNGSGPAMLPAHSVTLSTDYAISTTPITVAQFREFVQATSHRTTAETAGRAQHYGPSGWQSAQGASWRDGPGSNHPVVDVSWQDAVAYCQWLTATHRESGELANGLVYRLPTEAEWEYACRAGSTTPFPFGEPDNFAKFANCRDQASGLPNGNLWFEKVAEGNDGHAQTSPVRTYQANAWGLYDVHGNVWEWCLDAPRDYQSRPETDPRGPANDDRRAIRGGSWDSGLNELRADYRFAAPPDRAANNLGFRIVRAAD